MTVSVKNRIMRILAVIAIVCVGMVIAFAVKPAKAEQQVAGEAEFAVQADASIYIGEELSGIAFKTDVAKDYYEGLTGEVKFFTIVTAAKNLDDGDITSLTVENAEEKEAVIISPAETISFADGDVWTYTVAITYEDAQLSPEQLEEAYATKLVARSYLKITDGENETVIYAQNDTEATSIREVANATLAEAVDTPSALSKENVAKLMQYAEKKDVKAYTDTESQVDFIDQDLDGAKVYAVNETADGFDSLETIQNGALAYNAFDSEAAVGAKKQVVVVDGDQAFVTDITKVTKILRTKADFVDMFDYYDVEEAFAMATSEDVVTISGKTQVKFESDKYKETFGGYYVLATNVEITADDNFNPGGLMYGKNIIVNYQNDNPGWLADADFSTCSTVYPVAADFRTFTAESVFDGLGHYVDGIKHTDGRYSYLFGNAYGTIKNLAITNMQFGENGIQSGLANETAETTKIENVYVQVTYVGSNGGRLGDTYGGLFQKWKLGHLKNVIIEYPNVNAGVAEEKITGLGYIDCIAYGYLAGTSTKISAENVIAITETLAAGYYKTPRVELAGNDKDVTSIGGKDLSSVTKYISEEIRRYDDYAALKTANLDLSAFDNGIWDISTGAPIFASIVTGDVVVTVDGGEASEIGFLADGGETTATFDITSSAMDISFDAYVVDENIATYADGVITKVGNVAGETELVYSYVIAGVEYTGSIKIVITEVSNEVIDLGAAIFSATDKALPASLTDNIEGDIMSVNYLGSDIYAGNNTLNFVYEISNDVQEMDVEIITTEGTIYSATLLVYTDIITTAKEFQSIFWSTNGTEFGGAYILGNDIQNVGKVLNTGAVKTQQFTGLLDGNGYSILGFQVNANGMFGNLNNAVIKNLAITGINVTATGAIGVLALNNYGADTVIENVYIDVTSIADGSTDKANSKFGGLICNLHAKDCATFTMTDVIIVMPALEFDTALTYGPGTLGGSAATQVANNPTASNVIVISSMDTLAAYGGNKRLYVAENDAGLLEGDGKYASVAGTKGIIEGIFRYDDCATAAANGDVIVGGWTITENGIIKTPDVAQASYSLLSKKA